MEPITAIASVLTINALVQFGKQFGVVDKWSTLLAVVLGIILSLGDYLFLGDGSVTGRGVWLSLGAGLILGLTSSGLYDVAKAASTRVSLNASDVGDGTTTITVNSTTVH